MRSVKSCIVNNSALGDGYRNIDVEKPKYVMEGTCNFEIIDECNEEHPAL